MNMIPFNKPYLTGKEAHYMYQAVLSGKLSGNGVFTQRCQDFFSAQYGFSKCLLTTSCTDALEMSALLLQIQPGDEVIVPSYTFVSTANAFVLRGAKIVFADSMREHPNVDVTKLNALITPKTRAIVVVHYAGHACDMDAVVSVGARHGVAVVEDAAQAIDSYYNGKPLGGIGCLSAFSFHETKNIISGEGGMLAINDPVFQERAEIIWEKGTNRAAFFRGQTDKYGWVDVGSSFLPSEIIAAFLFAQLEHLATIQARRKEIWDMYYAMLGETALKEHFELPQVLPYATNNYHMFYLVCRSLAERTALIEFLRKNNVGAVFHYQSLHQSPYFQEKHDGRELPNADRFSDCLVRLPFYYELTKEQQLHVIKNIIAFYDR